MQQGNLIDVFLARHVSGTHAESSGALDVELQHMVLCTEFLDGWVVLRAAVYGADGAVRLTAPSAP